MRPTGLVFFDAFNTLMTSRWDSKQTFLAGLIQVGLNASEGTLRSCRMPVEDWTTRIGPAPSSRPRPAGAAAARQPAGYDLPSSIPGASATARRRNSYSSADSS
jgi:hypothetical protein